MKRHTVHTPRPRHFATLAEASAYASAYARKTGVVVAVTDRALDALNEAWHVVDAAAARHAGNGYTDAEAFEALVKANRRLFRLRRQMKG